MNHGGHIDGTSGPRRRLFLDSMPWLFGSRSRHGATGHRALDVAPRLARRYFGYKPGKIANSTLLILRPSALRMASEKAGRVTTAPSPCYPRRRMVKEAAARRLSPERQDTSTRKAWGGGPGANSGAHGMGCRPNGAMDCYDVP